MNLVIPTLCVHLGQLRGGGQRAGRGTHRSVPRLPSKHVYSSVYGWIQAWRPNMDLLWADFVDICLCDGVNNEQTRDLGRD